MAKHFAETMAEAAETSAKAVTMIAETCAKTEGNLRLTLALFGAALAMQPKMDAKKLLSDFDKLLEDNSTQGRGLPMAALDLRAALAKVASQK